MKLTGKLLGSGLIGLAVVLLILLSIVKLDLDSQSATLCELNSEAGVPMSECPFHNSSSSWILILAFGVTFTILGTGSYLLLYAKQTASIVSDFKDVDLSEMDDEERKVYDIIKEKEGSIFQSEIKREIGFSKVKVTRLLDGMEQKGILERKRRGMTNIVVLK